ncbi:hypothetical protein [Ectopseudomonas mendocina]|uniref:Uncharacterized protein n=1 Tax=Ectopseudomonas mendocina TaxID=300 RepID=A0A2R3QWG5_ECTME|nr:hypothetical protein [Pseudomonas mendocina]AVO56151.1 hypothetical protein C7A17_26550 [Pseudomonas mendocina]
MKDLTGTFKQIDWANSIRRDFVESCEKSIANFAPDFPAYLSAAEKNEKLRTTEVLANRKAQQEKFAALLVAAEDKTTAKFWIENRSDLAAALTKGAK